MAQAERLPQLVVRFDGVKPRSIEVDINHPELKKIVEFQIPTAETRAKDLPERKIILETNEGNYSVRQDELMNPQLNTLEGREAFFVELFTSVTGIKKVRIDEPH